MDFTSVKGITFFEVSRKFSNGLSFDTTGFQLEPSWVIKFISNDSVAAFSPDKSAWETFPLTYSHKDVYAFAREYFRIKSISKDSVVMQRLEVKSMEIDGGYRSDVNIVYYSHNYIFNKLKTDAALLKKPSKADSVFIRKLAERSNRNPSNVDSAFGARQPVLFQPVSKAVTVERKQTGNKVMDRSSAFNYLYPEYTIHLKGAYKNFTYSFAAIVDKDRNFTITRADGVLAGDAEPRKKALKGIVDVYLKNLFRITPGSTLGYPHSSEINIVIVGRTEK